MNGDKYADHEDNDQQKFYKYVNEINITKQVTLRNVVIRNENYFHGRDFDSEIKENDIDIV